MKIIKRILAWSLICNSVMAITPNEQLQAYSAAAQQSPDINRGEQLFTITHGREWSCASCHTRLPIREGRHAATGRSIAPLAPKINPGRFTDQRKIEKWFRRNCNDVLGRECTPAEKADILAWLLSLK